MQADQSQVVWTIIICAIVLLVVGLFSVASVNNKLESIDDYPTAAEIATLVVIPDIEYPEYTGDYVLTKSDYEDVLIEKEAEKLVLEEIDSRSFKRAVFDTLNLYYSNDNESEYYNCSNDEELDCAVENYRHITKIVVKDIEVFDVDEKSVVFVDLKVYYYIDGEDDEDFKARFKEITFDVTELIVDDDFEDAEVDYEELVIKKVY